MKSRTEQINCPHYSEERAELEEYATRVKLADAAMQRLIDNPSIVIDAIGNLPETVASAISRSNSEADNDEAILSAMLNDEPYDKKDPRPYTSLEDMKKYRHEKLLDRFQALQDKEKLCCLFGYCSLDLNE